MATEIKKTPKGCIEYTPSQFAHFNFLKESILKNYGKFGYGQIETSIMQFLNVLSNEGEISKEIYGINRAKAEDGSSESNRGLRFDLTTPLARYVAENQNNLVFPFKRSEAGLVYRGERPQEGRARQFYQLDFDVIGIDTLPLSYDAEVVELIMSTFNVLNIGEFQLRVNNRKLLQGILEFYGVQEGSIVSAFTIIDSFEKQGSETCKKRLIEETDLSSENALKVIEIISQKTKLKDSNHFLGNLPENELTNIGKEEIRALINLVDFDSFSLGQVVLDLSIARGLDYYTGFVCETNLIGLAGFETLSVCSGGRYDNLASKFTNSKLPGVGASIGLTRLFEILVKSNITSTNNSDKKIYFAIADSNKSSQTRVLANKLRHQGFMVEVSSGEVKLKKQFATASKLACKYCLILEDEDQITVKNMNEMTQKVTNFTDLTNVLLF
jgi:histidyl-tRNA synthetase